MPSKNRTKIKESILFSELGDSKKCWNAIVLLRHNILYDFEITNNNYVSFLALYIK